MSSSASSTAEEIRSPADLDLPPQAHEVFQNLSPYGREVFIGELFEALDESARKDNLRPLKDTIEAWYRTLIVRQDPNYEDNMKRAARSHPRKGISLDEVKGRIGVQ